MISKKLIGPVAGAILSAGILIGCAVDIDTTLRDGQDCDRAIDSQIARLRRQINRNGRQPIQTVYGVGYRFVTEDE